MVVNKHHKGVGKVSKNLKRFNIYMSQGIYDFYVQMAEELGIPISSAMVVALKSYMDMQQGLKMEGDLKRLLSQLEAQKQ